MKNSWFKAKSRNVGYSVLPAAALCLACFGCGDDDDGQGSPDGGGADSSVQNPDSGGMNAEAGPDAMADSAAADSSAAVCPTGTNGPTTHDQDIEADETWRAEDNPHIVVNRVRVGGDETRVVTLTLEPCVEVRFTSQSCLIVGEQATRGSLVANGAADKPILFTSDQEDGAKTAGYWDAILFGEDTAEDTLLDHVIIEYGGREGSGAHAGPNWDDGQIIAWGNGDRLPALKIRNTEIRAGSTNGIVMWSGARFGDDSLGLVISGNDEAPVVMEQDAAQTLPTDSESKYDGNGTDGIVIDSGGVTSITAGSPVWDDPRVPYINRGDINVDGAKLTVANGVTIASEADTEINVVTGSLVAEEVTFTSWPDTAHWGGIDFPEGGSGTLTDCIVERGGTRAGAGGWSEGFNINVDERTETDLPTITGCTIRASVVDGISLWGVDVSVYNGDNTFTGNPNCDVADYNPAPPATDTICWNH